VSERVRAADFGLWWGKGESERVRAPFLYGKAGG
jgi:hypothetical protein